jgi:hypothetical protein
MASTVTDKHETPDAVDVLADIGRDVKTIAVNQLELVRAQLSDYMERLVIRATVALLGATVALIGIGMLCMVGVVVLEGLIPPLWLRLLVMATLYIVVGATAAYLWGKRMTAMRGPEIDKQLAEIGDTVNAINNGLER